MTSITIENTGATELISGYRERFERVNAALEQIGEIMQSSGQRPAVDNAVVAELGDMEQYVSDIEERLFDINVKLYQLKKERCEIKNYGYVGSYIRPVGI